MVRDFTDEAKERLRNAILAAEAQDNSWWDRNIADPWADMFIKDDIADYNNDIIAFHEAIVDKKNTTQEKLNSIFDAVYAVEATYKLQFISKANSFGDINRAFAAVAEILNPTPSDGGSFYLLRPPSDISSALGIIQGVAYPEALAALMEASIGTGEIYMTPCGIVYEGELYPFEELSTIEEGGGQIPDNSGSTVVFEGAQVNAEFSWAEFVVGWLGGEPDSVDADNSVYAGGVQLRGSGESNKTEVSNLLLGGAESFAGAIDTYTVQVTLVQTPDGRRVAQMALTSSDYNEFRQNLPETPQYRTVRRPDGTTETVQVTFDPNRANSPYVAAVGVDSNGNLVAQPYVYPGDQVISGELDYWKNFTPDTVPLSSTDSNAPEALGDTPVPRDVTDEYLRPDYLSLNPEYTTMLES